MKKHCCIIVVIALILISLFRVYYGAGVGCRVVFKNGPAFKDTVVNVDDMRVMPRITLASNHPAVKRQLEAMGIFESDAKARQRITDEMPEDLKKQFREIGFLATYYLSASEMEKTVAVEETLESKK
ncbi:MAG: hypothetical protein ABIH09_04760 [Candidatus Omnitrophota bacterium]